MKLYLSLLFAFMLLAGPAWAVTGVCVNGVETGEVCECDDGATSSDYPCTDSDTGSGGSYTACGTGFTCAEADWAGSDADSSVTSFVASSDTSLTCGTQTAGCIAAASSSDTNFENACVSTSCRLSGTTCTDNDECHYCNEGLNSTGGMKTCTAHTDCGTGGRIVVRDSALEFCGNDNLRYALQPRKFIHYRDTNCDGIDDCDDRDDRIGTSFEIAELETTVPATPDSNFFAVASGIITVQRDGVYAVRAGVTPEFRGSKGGGLVLRGEVEQVAAACNATDTCGSSTCVYTGIGSAVFPTGGTSGPDITPTGTAALYIGSATYKESSLNIGLSTTGVLVLDRCDKVRITVKSTKIDDKKGQFYWKANQSHLYMEYLGGDEND